MSKKKIVVVLGMHRSGTSAIARGLEVLSVDLGNNLMPGIEGENDKGFFEDLDIQKFNERLLAKSGSSWHSLSVLHTGDFEKHAFEAERFEAADLIERKLADFGTFGFKDPRTALLLPFWQCIFNDLGISASYLLAVRNPLEVAESLRRRGQTDRMHAVLLWLKYNWAAITHTGSYPRVCVSYARFLDDRFGQLARIATALELQMPATSDPKLNEFVSQFLEAKLRHNRISDKEIIRENNFPEIVAPIYRTLMDWAEADPGQVLEVSPKLRGRVESFWENTNPVLQFGDRLRHSGNLARSARAKAEAELDEMRAALERTQSKLVKTEADLLAASEESLSANRRLAELGEKAAALEGAASDAKVALAVCGEEIEKLKDDLSSKAKRIRELEDAGAEAEYVAATLRSQLFQTTKAKDDALASLNQLRAQAEHLSTALATKDRHLNELEVLRATAERTATERSKLLEVAMADATRNALSFANEQKETNKLKAQLAENKKQIEHLNEFVVQIDAKHATKRKELAEKTTALRLTRHELYKIQSSTSWRLTKPLRAGKKVLSRSLRAASRMISRRTSISQEARDE